jgi:hypothetical protein
VTSALHPEIREVIHCRTAEAALQLASIVSTPSAVWTDEAWLTVAACANSAAISDSSWLAVCILAHEKRSADVAVIDALLTRARFLVVSGPDERDRFRDPATFFEGLRRFIDGDVAQAALQAFQRAMSLVFTADRGSTDWADARLQFIRGRRLRDIGRALRAVADRGIAIPTDLAEWLAWADVREVDGRVVT